MNPHNCMECENSHITIPNGYCRCKLTGNCYSPIIMADKISEYCPLYNKESEVDEMNDIVIMSPTVNRAVYEWQAFLSRRSAIVKRANRAGLYVELLNGQKIYFKGETEGQRVLLGLRADIVTVDEFNERVQKEV